MSLILLQKTFILIRKIVYRINKAHRSMGVLENEEEGEKYAKHSLRNFLRTRPPQVMPSINRFFSNHDNN